MDGCEVFLDVVDEGEESALLAWVDDQLAKGRRGELEGKTYYPPPPKWTCRGQSREMLQYGAFTHANRVQLNVPLRRDLPPILRKAVASMASAGVFPSPEQLPDACTINVYAEGNYLPPHVDSDDFARPFATLSLSSQAALSLTSCEDDAPILVQMPRRSVVRMMPPAAGPDVKHGLPPHPHRRVSLTFRRISDACRRRHEAERRDRDERERAKADRKRRQKKAKKEAKAKKRKSRNDS